mgnify:CR=1 FL=1
MFKAEPLTIRGITYQSQNAAAKAFGISGAAVSIAKKKGRLDTVGLDPKKTEAYPVVIRGVEYPSQYAAAKALNVSPTTIWNALERGKIDNVGARKK